MWRLRELRPDPWGIVAFAVTIVGLNVLYRGMYNSLPGLFGEPAPQSYGRVLILIGTGVLAGAMVLLLARDRPRLAWLVVSPGLVCAVFAFALPEGGFQAVAFLCLSPLSFAAALIGCVAPKSNSPVPNETGDRSQRV